MIWKRRANVHMTGTLASTGLQARATNRRRHVQYCTADGRDEAAAFSGWGSAFYRYGNRDGANTERAREQVSNIPPGRVWIFGLAVVSMAWWCAEYERPARRIKDHIFFLRITDSLLPLDFHERPALARHRYRRPSATVPSGAHVRGVLTYETVLHPRSFETI